MMGFFEEKSYPVHLLSLEGQSETSLQLSGCRISCDLFQSLVKEVQETSHGKQSDVAYDIHGLYYHEVPPYTHAAEMRRLRF